MYVPFKYVLFRFIECWLSVKSYGGSSELVIGVHSWLFVDIRGHSLVIVLVFMFIWSHSCFFVVVRGDSLSFVVIRGHL